ncbi:hypothetical protein GGR50DRAFT_451902 [Xylaria sp. CBS 124048]|nr:hypothetical protein GGR50DRAFT_451902 [Xylaria sp. CBS 124048]
MSTVLGKRKSRLQKADTSISQEEAQAKLAKFFEASFKPLFPTAQPTPTAKPEKEEPAPSPDDSDDGSDDDSWDGLSGAESEDESEDESTTLSPAVEVVAHTDEYTKVTESLDKRESRVWLSSRPPLPTNTSSSTSQHKKGKQTTAEEDAPSLLKNDLALQRLLAESHLFSSAAAKNGSTTADTTEHVGRNRHLATDLRLVALGSKSSIHKQAKMPMSFRKGIQAAAEGRESKRRREAKENGIVLERPGLGSKKGAKGRRTGPSRDIDAPAVGRLSNGMLKLSKKDIASIESGGPRKGGTFTKKRRR